MKPKPKPKRIIRKPAVKSKTGLPSSTLYDKIQRGEFPKQIKLGPRASGWIEEEVDQWIEEQIAASRSGEAA